MIYNIEKDQGRVRKFFKILGPGFITGAADDDPSGILTYSQTGAQFGYGQLWVSAFTLPLMVAIQEASARIGLATGKGIVAIIKEHYSKSLALAVVWLILIANTINIGADIGAMAAATKLIIPINFVVLTLAFTALILVLEIFVSYRSYAEILKWLGLSLAAYVITALIVKEPWGTILHATFIPHIELSFPFLFLITGVIGTTISPYMFIWEANEEVEEEREQGLLDENGTPHIGESEIRHMRLDNFIGMLSSNFVTWCVIVTAATVLFQNGVHTINTSADAARALEPLVQSFPHAGFIAKLIFSLGIVGLGLLAVPVLSASASYAVSEAFNWHASLNDKLQQAHGFYGVITIATLLGLVINFIGIDPVQALVVAAVINGVVAVPLIFLVAKIARNKEIMGEFTSKNLSIFFTWLTFFFVAAAAIGMFFTFF